MKKLITLLLIVLVLSSCNRDDRVPSTTVEYTNNNQVNYITIHSNDHKYDYEKIKIDGHDFLFRTWGTKYGYGSDLVHNPSCTNPNHRY